MSKEDSKFESCQPILNILKWLLYNFIMKKVQEEIKDHGNELLDDDHFVGKKLLRGCLE